MKLPSLLYLLLLSYCDLAHVFAYLRGRMFSFHSKHALTPFPYCFNGKKHFTIAFMVGVPYRETILRNFQM
jgi:hypothetical protein